MASQCSTPVTETLFWNVTQLKNYCVVSSSTVTSVLMLVLQLRLRLHGTGSEPFWTELDRISLCLHGTAWNQSRCLHGTFWKQPGTPGGGGGGGYSRFQVMGMIKGFFWGLKFWILRFFWLWKFGKYFFGWLDDLSRDLIWVLKNNLKICGSARVSQLRSSANEVTCFAVVLIFNTLHCICFIRPVVRNVLAWLDVVLLELSFVM